MAVAVVDELEVIDVDKEGGYLCIHIPVELSLELTLEGISVVKL